jgi:hypothetical protein
VCFPVDVILLFQQRPPPAIAMFFLPSSYRAFAVKITSSGKSVPYQIVDRRAGDIAQCWAGSALARDKLGWSARRTLEEMCVDAGSWGILKGIDGCRELYWSKLEVQILERNQLRALRHKLLQHWHKNTCD